MDWKPSAEMFAILASYLIITLPLAGATEVSIYYGGAQSGDPIELDCSEFIEKSVSINNPGGETSITVSVDNGSSGTEILESHVYRCGGRDPRVCVNQVTPVTYEGAFSAEYPWSDVSGGSGYPQEGNIMTLVKVKRLGGVSWTGSWDIVMRTSELNFALDSREIDEIEVHAEGAQFLGQIRYYVENFLMIPMNPGWISKVVFRTATEIRGLESDEPPEFWVETISGDELESITNSYYFAFPKNDSGIMGSVSLSLNPDYTCGDGTCEDYVGEGQTNCCYDCGCPAGYYCDAEMLCKSTNAITLSLHGTPDTRVINCNEDHVIYIPIKVNNPPSDAIVKGFRYRLAGYVEPTTCTGGPGVFSCAVNVPAVEDCGTGDYNVGPNSLTLVIEYSSGEATVTKELSTSFPNVTIGSFECGNLACESGLGETQSSCCLDCGCPAGKYCDWGGFGSVPSDAKCRDPIVNSDLYMVSIEPSHFYDQRYGPNSADIVIGVQNSPSNLNMESLSCEMRCSGSGGECESTCVVEDCESGYESGEHRTECTLSLYVTNYDPLTDYEISPVFTADVRYSNGTTGVMEATLVSTFPVISIGSHWCGDRVCGIDEGYLICCYDCGCPDGYYCDTYDTDGPTSGDGCRNRDFGVDMDYVEDDMFQDSSIQHYLDVTGHIPNYPSGTSVSGECLMQAGEFECMMICTRAESQYEDEYNFTCQMIIPPIDYVGSPYFRPASRELVLTQSMFSITHTYNEGPDKMKETYDIPVDEIRINVTTHCGEGGCEESFDETQSSCCRDCGCSAYGDDYFCYTGQNPNGVCLPNSSIILDITGFEPDPTDCFIYREGVTCRITTSTLAHVKIVNPPEGVSVVESYYSAVEQEDTPVLCNETGENHYVCPFALENITVPGAAEPGITNVSVKAMMIINYNISNFTVTQSIEGEAELGINKEYTEAVQDCIAEIAAAERQIADLDKSMSETTMWQSVFSFLAILFMIMFIITRSPNFLVDSIISQQKAIEEGERHGDQSEQQEAIRQQILEKKEMCDSLDVPELTVAEGNALTPIPPPK
jgi:hypothetical protein